MQMVTTKGVYGMRQFPDVPACLPLERTWGGRELFTLRMGLVSYKGQPMLMVMYRRASGRVLGDMFPAPNFFVPDPTFIQLVAEDVETRRLFGGGGLRAPTNSLVLGGIMKQIGLR